MRTSVDLLVLGAGWVSTFIKDLCDTSSLSYYGTTRTGRDSTIKFVFDPNSNDPTPYTALPAARTVVITFPITQKGAASLLVKLYSETHERNAVPGQKTRFIQLGATSIWDGKRLNSENVQRTVESRWYDRHSAYIVTPRAESEDEFLALSPSFATTVLNLAGLWGGTRCPQNWVAKVAPSKEALKAKGSIHLIHGMDIARAILAVDKDFDRADGQRWILTDGRVYDWWDLASAWGDNSQSVSGDRLAASGENSRGPQSAWVRELMDESGIRALPRNTELLGRALDSREFWKTFNLSPIYARIT